MPETRPTETGPRRRIKDMEVMVAEVKVETHDTVTLILFTGNDHLEYKAGHFLAIDPHQFEALDRFIAFFEDVKGKKEPTRAYSISSAPHERYLAITVKEERYVSGLTRYPPLLSPLLVKRTTRGMRLVITGFTGPYVLPDDVEQGTDHLVHVVAGSGAVPNFAMVKWALVHCPSICHTWVCSNKSWQDVIFREEPRPAGAREPVPSPGREPPHARPGHPGLAGGLEGAAQRGHLEGARARPPRRPSPT